MKQGNKKATSSFMPFLFIISELFINRRLGIKYKILAVKVRTIKYKNKVNDVFSSKQDPTIRSHSVLEFSADSLFFLIPTGETLRKKSKSCSPQYKPYGKQHFNN